MSKQLGIVFLTLLLSTFGLGQSTLVDGVPHEPGYGGLPTPVLEIWESPTHYLISARQCLTYSPVFLSLSTAQGLGFVDCGGFGLLRVPIVDPITVFLGGANVVDQVQLSLGKPPLGALPPELEGLPLHAVVISLGAAHADDTKTGYHTYVTSSDAASFTLSSASY